MSPRKKQIRRVGSPPAIKGFIPIGIADKKENVVSILYEEYEAFRLVDYSGSNQEEAAKFMNVSRPTFTRIYNSCLKKIAKAFGEGHSIIIEGGDVEFEKQWYRCNDCITVFHHHDDKNQECISCESEDIEHINKSIRDWKVKQANSKRKINVEEYCICPSCNYEELHKRGVPCFALACPNCNTPLIRKGI